MFDRPIIALKDEEEMEDFHDYEDEEQGEMDSKLDDYEDGEEDEDDDDADEVAPAAPEVVAMVVELESVPEFVAEPAPAGEAEAPPKKPVKKASSAGKTSSAKKA